MFNLGIKAFLALSAAWGVSADSFEFDYGLARRLTNSTNSTTKCKQTNDFMYSECKGEKTAFLCCTPEEACVSADQKSGTKTVKKIVCSKDRKLAGIKAVRILVIPLFGLLGGVCVVGKMLKSFGFKASTLLCVAVIGMSWPLAISEMYAFYFWAVFLAFLVAAVCTGKLDVPWYVYRLVWLVEVFQVVAIFGDYEAFFVPLWGDSGATAAGMLLDTKFNGTKCNDFYEKYFKVLDIEKNAINANPIAKNFGLCSDEWLAFVQCAVIFQGLVWMVTAVYTAPMLLSPGGQKLGDGPKAPEA